MAKKRTVKGSGAKVKKSAARERVSQSAKAPAIAYVASFCAWLVPGSGHLMLGRRGRGLAFAVLVLAAVALGCLLHGQLWSTFRGSPLLILRSLGCLGSGLPYFALLLSDYSGQIESVSFDYGSAFLVTGGLMNFLLVLDTWDIATGRKPDGDGEQ